MLSNLDNTYCSLNFNEENKMKNTIVHAYADDKMDLELFQFETTEIRIPNIVNQVETKTNDWQHILITFPKQSDGYIGLSRKQWH